MCFGDAAVFESFLHLSVNPSHNFSKKPRYNSLVHHVRLWSVINSLSGLSKTFVCVSSGTVSLNSHFHTFLKYALYLPSCPHQRFHLYSCQRDPQRCNTSYANECSLPDSQWHFIVTVCVRSRQYSVLQPCSLTSTGAQLIRDVTNSSTSLQSSCIIFLPGCPLSSFWI